MFSLVDGVQIQFSPFAQPYTIYGPQSHHIYNAHFKKAGFSTPSCGDSKYAIVAITSHASVFLKRNY